MYSCVGAFPPISTDGCSATFHNACAALKLQLRHLFEQRPFLVVVGHHRFLVGWRGRVCCNWPGYRLLLSVVQALRSRWCCRRGSVMAIAEGMIPFAMAAGRLVWASVGPVMPAECVRCFTIVTRRGRVRHTNTLRRVAPFVSELAEADVLVKLLEIYIAVDFGSIGVGRLVGTSGWCLLCC